MQWPAVVEWGRSADAALPVGSWPFELLFIRSQRCGCGGPLDSAGHRVVPGPRPLERHEAVCERCGARRPVWFDISAFHGDVGAYARFEELRALFEEGLQRVEDGDLAGADLRFREVAAREPWFGLAHYHLGMIAMVGDRYDEARGHLETAAAILPLDPAIHSALADLWSLTERHGRAARAAAVAASLRALLGDDDDDEELDDLPSGE
jgi:tetratricopeptide (TPR) repeat protein